VAYVNPTVSMRDPLYGLVKVTEEEAKIIRSNIFERLMEIKQLGLARKHYLGASHTRFEHSIGTLHICQLMLDTLWDRLNELREHVNERLMDTRWREKTTRVIRLAALLHDLGHGPFSHTIEEMLFRFKGWQPSYEGSKLKFHEDFTRHLLSENRELSNLLNSDDRKQIKEILGGNFKPRFISDLIVGDIGSDRVDYLLRDTYYTGLGHRPEIHELIDHLRLIPNKGDVLLGMDEEGIKSVELLLTNRYYHYTIIVHHPVNRSAELGFLINLQEIVRKNRKPDRLLLKIFTNFDDCNVMQMLKKGKLGQKNFQLVYRLALYDVRYVCGRYYLYRISEDWQAIKNYEDHVKTNLSDRDVPKKVGFNIDDLVLDLSRLRSRVPTLPIDREKYTRDRVENNIRHISRYSCLLVEYSPLLIELAKSQVLSNTLSFFLNNATSKAKEMLKKQLFEHMEAYVGENILKNEVAKSLGADHKLDRLILFFGALSTCPEGNYLNKITGFYDLVHKYAPFFGYDHDDFYMYQVKQTEGFIFNPVLFNDLIALSALGMINLEYLSDRSRTRIEENGTIRTAFFSHYSISPTAFISDVLELYKKSYPNCNNIFPEFQKKLNANISNLKISDKKYYYQMKK